MMITSERSAPARALSSPPRRGAGGRHRDHRVHDVVPFGQVLVLERLDGELGHGRSFLADGSGGRQRRHWDHRDGHVVVATFGECGVDEAVGEDE